MTMKYKPSKAFIGASYAALGLGMLSFLIGLWNAGMPLNEKGYYFSVLMFGSFSVVALQKTIRDKLENIQTTNAFLGICWAGTGISLALLVIGLWNADIVLSEKGFYGISYILTIFSAITVQKNTRDTMIYYIHNPEDEIIEEQTQDIWHKEKDSE